MTTPVKSADRTLDILEALATAGPSTLSELTRLLDIPKSSLHGILRTMTARGWIEATDTRFRLGLKALQVGAAYLDADDTVGLLAGILDDLAARFGETTHLGRLDGPDIIYVAKRESIHPLRLYSAIGRRLPAHATALGKALLATRPPAEVDALLPDPLPALTPHTITDRGALHAELTAIRRSGYAVDREENTEGIVCVARTVPMRDPITDAISLSIPKSRVGESTVDEVATALEAAVHKAASAKRFL
ncbi:IclR family transcriptional regulator [Dactylosporangium vinaceum]|uniref:IclR family transcriptional regulator n=1 Tax=Dactylosporangium vinaceum TaxID=53362 RepID=A0ABV5LZT9_9ACTN|nr:IclR family transcriptional regulator [Dactylosporangium vinaceum]UAB94383.1 IclR family transcriptional regulator [Dactylosporangium vinaceum]